MRGWKSSVHDARAEKEQIITTVKVVYPPNGVVDMSDFADLEFDTYASKTGEEQILKYWLRNTSLFLTVTEKTRVIDRRLEDLRQDLLNNIHAQKENIKAFENEVAVAKLAFEDAFSDAEKSRNKAFYEITVEAFKLAEYGLDPFILKSTEIYVEQINEIALEKQSESLLHWSENWYPRCGWYYIEGPEKKRPGRLESQECIVWW